MQSKLMLQALCAGKKNGSENMKAITNRSGSYNKINGSYACENGGVMNKLLKEELGYRGYILSDWNGMP